jgi:Putative metallopeptidase
MRKLTATALLFVAVVIVLLTSVQGHAQTPEQAWSTFIGDNRPDLQPNRIRIEYLEPSNKDLLPVYWVMLRRRPLQRIREIFSPLRLPVELTVRTKECGMSNAWYQRPTITLCYEYLREMREAAPKETSPDGITPLDAIVGQFLYTAAHEMGHAVFDLLNVPVFGPPEADADEFAAHVLMSVGKQDARRLIMGAAYMYKDYFKNPTITVPVTAFADIHGAPMQRMYNLMCLAYGADPELFSDVVEKGYLPRSRIPACKREWGEVNYAFEQLIYPYVDKTMLNNVLAKSWVPYRAPLPPRTSDLPQAAQ